MHCFSVSLWCPSFFSVGQGDWKESTAMAESKVPETFIQAGLLHTKELWKVFGGGPYDFRSLRGGLTCG